MSLTALAESELARSGLRLSFELELEARYRRDIAVERSRELRNLLYISTFLYFSIGGLMKLAGVTHSSWPGILLQLVGASAGVLLLGHYCFEPKTADTLRETSALACCLLASVAAILVTFSRLATMQDLIIAALPTNFILMFVRLRFPFAAVFSLVTFCSYAATVCLQSSIAPPQQVFLITFMAILCLPALIGVHSLERALASPLSSRLAATPTHCASGGAK